MRIISLYMLDDQVIQINANHIVAVAPRLSGSLVTMADGKQVDVKEDGNYIVRIIQSTKPI